MFKRIEHYSDYRLFLKDFYEDRKKRSPHFSYRTFCSKAKIASPSLLREVIQGKRNLTSSTIAAFVKGLGLTDRDAACFSLLVRFNQSKTAEEKQQFLDQLRGRVRTVMQKPVPLDHYEYYAVWYHPVVRELVCLLDWKDDYKKLARSVNPPISVAEARKSVSLLIKLGMISKEANGHYVQTDPAITTGAEVMNVGVRALNRQFSELGTTALERIPPPERDISSMTIGVSKKSFSQIKQEIQEFKKRIVRIVDDDKDSDSVYTVNVHLFPVSNLNLLQGDSHE